MRDVWNELLEFESRDLLERFFKRYHNSDVNEWKVRQVSSNFIQGREYFRSAKEASITVRPLLLYYGIVSLGRGLTLMLKPKLNETNLKGSHGLEVKNWSTVLSNRQFEDLQISVGEGSFSELLSGTQNRNYLRVGADAVNFSNALKMPEKECLINFRDLFNFLPDLNREFSVWINEPLPFLLYSPTHTTQGIPNRTIISVYDTSVTDDLVEQIFPERYCPERTITRFERHVIIKYESAAWAPNFTQKWHGAFGLGELCIVPPLKDDVGLNSLGAMFAVSYVLGMMARYYPSTWISLGQVQRGDRILPLINRFLSFVQEVYPQAILDFLRAPYSFEQVSQK